MVGGSSGNTADAASNPSNLDGMSFKKNFLCNTCDLVFNNSLAQRTHMREPWHIFNLKLRMSSLPPISAHTYAESVATTLMPSKQKSSNLGSPSTEVAPLLKAEHTEVSDGSEDSISEESRINYCLFCTEDLGNLDANFKHMASDHGLYLPQIENVSSLETIITYLGIVITEYNECLYCGKVEQSTEATREHMFDNSHCMINLEREPELLEFWELSDSDGDNTDDEIAQAPAQRLDILDGEFTLPSGKVVGSKNKARAARLSARRIALATKEISSQMIDAEVPTNKTEKTPPAKLAKSLIQSKGEASRGSQDRTVAMRDAVGLVGVSDQQIQSLVAIERKMQRQKAVVEASASWVNELGGFHQKHYKQKMNLRGG